MTRRRFYAPPACFAPDGARVTLSVEESRHLRDVLRLQAGDEAFVFDGEGAEFRCIVCDERGRSTSRRNVGTGVTLEVRERVAAMRPESPLELTLAAALLKGEKFDLVVQKATELGVARVIPVETKRSDVRLRDERDTLKRTGRWQRLALEAAKQSGRARLPSIEAPRDLASLLACASKEHELRLMFAERDGDALLDASGERATQPASVTALVGPEGGWEAEEIAAARAAGWSIITLGGRILRAETACLTVAVLLEHLYGDLK